MSFLLLLATVIPLGWLVLGAIMLWQHAMLHRSEKISVLAPVLIALRWPLPNWKCHVELS